MKNPLIAITILAMTATGLIAVVFMPDSSTPAETPKTVKASEPISDNTSTINSTAASVAAPPVTPMTTCNELGLPRPTVSDHSALHDPQIVESILRKVPARITNALQIEAPQSADAAPDQPEGMVWVRGGIAVMGSDVGPPDEEPPHPIALDGFWMDATEVTNQQFKEFVDATGYVTLLERKPELRSIQPGSGLEQLAIMEEFNQPGSICSLQLNSRDDIDPAKGAYSWWQYVPGADWKHPEGPDSNIENRMDHPVVHVSWPDAQAYCEWAGKQLPTEAQWEYAARGGRSGQFYPWGNDRNPDGTWKQNIWQGTFPIEDTGEDGFKTTSPVATFEPNDFGLYDMSGNVWEWCADYYQPDYYAVSPQLNPPGPETSFDPQEPGIIKRVQRGGSFMCSEQYCIGYRVSARMKGEEDTGAFHTGFRCIIVPPKQPAAE